MSGALVPSRIDKQLDELYRYAVQFDQLSLKLASAEASSLPELYAQYQREQKNSAYDAGRVFDELVGVVSSASYREKLRRRQQVLNSAGIKYRELFASHPLLIEDCSEKTAVAYWFRQLQARLEPISKEIILLEEFNVFWKKFQALVEKNPRSFMVEVIDMENEFFAVLRHFDYPYLDHFVHDPDLANWSYDVFKTEILDRREAVYQKHYDLMYAWAEGEEVVCSPVEKPDEIDVFEPLPPPPYALEPVVTLPSAVVRPKARPVLSLVHTGAVSIPPRHDASLSKPIRGRARTSSDATSVTIVSPPGPTPVRDVCLSPPPIRLSGGKPPLARRVAKDAFVVVDAASDSPKVSAWERFKRGARELDELFKDIGI